MSGALAAVFDSGGGELWARRCAFSLGSRDSPARVRDDGPLRLVDDAGRAGTRHPRDRDGEFGPSPDRSV